MRPGKDQSPLSGYVVQTRLRAARPASDDLTEAEYTATIQGPVAARVLTASSPFIAHTFRKSHGAS